MNFSQEQIEYISQFIMSYNSDEEFKIDRQDKYDNDLKSLSILDIYALEEVLRYGTKKVYDKFIEAKGLMGDDVAAKTYDEFVKLMSEDESFMQYKREQVLYSPSTLSAIEMLAFEIVGMPEEEKVQNDEQEEKEDTKEESYQGEVLTYDQLNPIRSATDREVKETLENLIMGEFIHKILEHPAMSQIKDRCDGGKIANVDKPFIIEKVKTVTSSPDFPSQLKQLVDSAYVKVKMNLLLQKSQEEAFAEYLQFNTNISIYEIFGLGRAMFEEYDAYQFFQDIINNRRQV